MQDNILGQCELSNSQDLYILNKQLFLTSVKRQALESEFLSMHRHLFTDGILQTSENIICFARKSAINPVLVKGTKELEFIFPKLGH